VRSEERLNYSRQPETDIEVCTSVQSLEGFARGQGIWQGLSLDTRIKQLEHAAFLTDEMYPSFRWYLFDAVGDYAAPVTIFGSKRAALYVGDMYLVFNTTEHIRMLSRRFDNLIRRATVQAHTVSHRLHGIVDELKAHGDLKPQG
jgi:hypothetical protein